MAHISAFFINGTAYQLSVDAIADMPNLTPDVYPRAGSSQFISSGAVAEALATKVDAVTGKGLSENDYTTAEKIKLAGIDTEANKTLVDDTLSAESHNAVMNSVVSEALYAVLNRIQNLEEAVRELRSQTTVGPYAMLQNASVNSNGIALLNSMNTSVNSNQILVFSNAFVEMT